MASKLAHRIEEAILVFIILLNIFEFFGWFSFMDIGLSSELAGDIDFAKKIISWILLGYLFYTIKISKIMFGEEQAYLGSKIKNWHIDSMVLLSYFLLIFTKLIVSTESFVEHHPIFGTIYKIHVFGPLVDFLTSNAELLNLVTIYIGIALLLLVSILLATKFHITAPSLMHVIHEEGPPPRSLKKIIHRVLTSFLVLVGFFVVVFNLMMEWLAIAVDNIIIMLGIGVYLFVIVRYHKHFSTDALIHKIGNFGESFYERFLEMFHSKKGLFMGLSGMLVLHIITDIGNFVLPYIFTFKSVFYLEHLGASTHMPLIKLFMLDKLLYPGINLFALFLVYLLNLIALVMLMAIPAGIWYKVYHTEHGIKIHNWELLVFFSALSAFILSPIFRIRSIGSEYSIVGVDILTHQTTPVFNIWIVILVSLFAGTLAYWLGNTSFRNKIARSAIAVSTVYFGFYVSYFALSVLKSYAISIPALFAGNHWIIGFYMILILIMTLGFYMAGLVIFIKETIYEARMMY